MKNVIKRKPKQQLWPEIVYFFGLKFMKLKQKCLDVYEKCSSFYKILGP